MCGIAGSVRFPLPFEEVKSLLIHRGPDEQNLWSQAPVELINTRLAIQGLGEEGRQPMRLDQLVIVFNGEIYNHQELRQKYNLACLGHSDTETLLHLYRKLGKEMLKELDGMFAFCLYDMDRSLLWLARDRAGEKPLYYYHQGDAFVFASELKAMASLVKVTVDDQKISNFLAIGYLVDDQTPYRVVKQLQAGHCLEYNIDQNSLTNKKWWSTFDQYHAKRFKGSFEEALEETDRLLRQSVKRRITSSEREVGCFLSSGIDSGLISAYAVQSTTRLKTFTIAFDGLFDEGPIAHEVARHLGTDHREIRIGLDDLEQDIEKIFTNYGEPMVDDSIIPSYYVAKEAVRYVPVVLTGDGGDELFGGYRRYVPFSKIDFLSNRFRSLAGPIHRLLPFPRNKMHYYNYAYRFMGLLANDWDEVYFAATLDLLHDYNSQFLVKPDYTAYSGIIEPVIESGWNGLRKIMYLDNVMLLQQILLKKMDIATMAHSLESRTPFLSSELLHLAPSLPEAWKVKGGKTKYLLRKVAEKYLPPEVCVRPKMGFEIPLQKWVDTKLKTVIYDHLSPANAYVKTILSPNFVDELLDDKSAYNPEKRAKALFAILSVEVWRKGLYK